jgi:hypothetical protein
MRWSCNLAWLLSYVLAVPLYAAQLSSTDFELSFPAGWKLSSHPAGFFVASPSDDKRTLPFLAVQPCRAVGLQDCAKIAGSYLETGISRDAIKGWPAPASFVALPRSDGVREFSSSSSGPYNGANAFALFRLFVFPDDYLLVFYMSSAESQAHAAAELEAILSTNLRLNLGTR